MATVAQALQPFFWQGSSKVTASDLERQRRIADALRAPEGYRPTGPWSAVGALAGEGVAAMRDKKTEADENAAQDLVSKALAGGDYLGVMGNDVATPQQSAVAAALYQQQVKENDPDTALEREFKQAQIDALNAKPGQPLVNAGNGSIYDPNSGKWITQTSADGTKPPNVKGESDLRTEYNGINTVKDYGLQTQAYQRVLDSAREPSAAGDLALIFNYMKVLDPGSTVREGEFATAQNSGSVPEQIWAQYNKIMSGERLTPDIRKDFVKRAGQLFKGASDLQGRTNERYSSLATDYGFNPERIVAPVPQIGVLDPSFNIDEYLTPDGQQKKPLPVTGEADYNAIPKGAQYVDPDGNIRTKQ